jgi:hypothetical protein
VSYACWRALVNLRTEPALGLQYVRKSLERDLKPPPPVATEYLQRMRARGGLSEALACALLSDVATDHSGHAKPTALHFTAGQQRFLGMALDLLEGLTHVHVRAALFGPWQRQSNLPRFEWDATLDRRYAYSASDPSKDKKTSVPGANALALLGLSLLPSVPQGTKLQTTGTTGRWKSGTFSWGLWTQPLGLDTVRSLLQLPPRRRPGVAQIFACAIHRSDQGGYGSFAPSRART